MIKKRMKKIYAMMLLFCFVLGTFAGCGKSGASNDDASNTGASAQPSQTNSDPMKLRRLVPEGETVTLKAWRPTHTTIGTRIEGWGDTLFNKWMEEQTGVHIEWITPVGGTEADNLAMLISSGEYPDLFFDAGGCYSTGAYGLMKDGVVIDVAKYLDKLPNYKSQLEKSEYRQKESYSDNKEMAALYRFTKADLPDTTWFGILMRQDLLDKVNMEVPATYDDWHTVLTAFKDQLGIEKPYLLNYTGFPKLDMFTGGLGFGYMNYGGGAQKPFYQVDGVIHYAPLEDNFKQYLQMMNQWYNEGLIDQDFLSLNTIDAEISTFSNPMSGAMVAPLSFESVLKQLMADDSVDFVAVPNPVVKEGDKIHIGATGSSVLSGIQISSKCENLDIALQWSDLYYSDDVIDISNWGTDESYYTTDENGNKHFNDKVFKNEDGFAAYDMIFSIADYPCIMENDRTIGDSELIEEGKIYDNQNDNTYAISDALTMTDEESDVYNSIMSKVNDYVEEMQVKFIMGIESFDNYDAFVSNIRDMKVEDAMAAYQAALERYNSR